MKKILFRFPFWYYLNPINFLGVGVLGFITYYNTVRIFSEIAEFEKFNVAHSHNQFFVPYYLGNFKCFIISVCIFLHF